MKIFKLKMFATEKEARRYRIIKWLVCLLVLAILIGASYYLGARFG